MPTEASGITLGPSVTRGSTVLQATKLMTSEGVSEVYVTDENSEPIGVVRQIDVVRAVCDAGDPSRLAVDEIMLRPPPAVDDEAGMEEVSRVITKNDVKHVLVKRRKDIVGVIEVGELFGLISSSMKGVGVFKAVSARARLRIAELLSVAPMSVDDIAGELGIKPITVRHHISVLRTNGIVEEVQDQWSGKVGRPLSLFKLTKSILKRSIF